MRRECLRRLTKRSMRLRKTYLALSALADCHCSREAPNSPEPNALTVLGLHEPNAVVEGIDDLEFYTVPLILKPRLHVAIVLGMKLFVQVADAPHVDAHATTG